MNVSPGNTSVGCRRRLCLFKFHIQLSILLECEYRLSCVCALWPQSVYCEMTLCACVCACVRACVCVVCEVRHLYGRPHRLAVMHSVVIVMVKVGVGSCGTALC